MKLLLRDLLVPLSLISFLVPQSGWTKDDKKQFNVNDNAGRDAVHFVLDAPFEVINGNTNKVKGKFAFEGGKLAGEFTVPVSSIKTGIETRDEHLLNDKWMDAAKFPTLDLSFKGVAVPDSLWKGEDLTLEVPGEFKIHGVKRTEKVKLVLHYYAADANTAKRLPGNLLRAKAEFQIQLADYGIAQSDSKVKELLGLKVGKTAVVTADLMASDKTSL